MTVAEMGSAEMGSEYFFSRSPRPWKWGQSTFLVGRPGRAKRTQENVL
jgi:hypothetical protein